MQPRTRRMSLISRSSLPASLSSAVRRSSACTASRPRRGSCAIARRALHELGAHFPRTRERLCPLDIRVRRRGAVHEHGYANGRPRRSADHARRRATSTRRRGSSYQPGIAAPGRAGRSWRRSARRPDRACRTVRCCADRHRSAWRGRRPASHSPPATTGRSRAHSRVRSRSRPAEAAEARHERMFV